MKIKKYILKKYTLLGIIMMTIVYILSLPTIVYGTSNNATSQNITVNVSITNSAPVVTEVTLKDAEGAGTMDLSPNTSVVINCSGRAYDIDGASDLSTDGTINATLFDSTSGPDLVANFSTHYKNSSCTITNPDGDPTNVSFECGFNVFFNANPDTWTCNVSAIDANSGFNVDNTKTDTETMGVLMALDVTSSIEFGEMSVDSDTGSTDTTSVVYNEGNIIFDINLWAWGNSSNITSHNISMVCGTNTINNSHLKYSLTASQSWAAQKIVINNTGTGRDDTAFNLERNNTAESDLSVPPVPSYKNIYWGLGIPANPIVTGTCNGTVQFTAITDT